MVPNYLREGTSSFALGGGGGGGQLLDAALSPTTTDPHPGRAVAANRQPLARAITRPHRWGSNLEVAVVHPGPGEALMEPHPG